MEEYPDMVYTGNEARFFVNGKWSDWGPLFEDPELNDFVKKAFEVKR